MREREREKERGGKNHHAAKKFAVSDSHSSKVGDGGDKQERGRNDSESLARVRMTRNAAVQSILTPSSLKNDVSTLFLKMNMRNYLLTLPSFFFKYTTSFYHVPKKKRKKERK